ncbi:sigma-70 family RNA polymerase sigma factor [Xylanimonas allomyrinae]|uniref:Sigma-70 family RNA polymerase sigma factor n=1 Tax=Xylanimonas allomyrinae TaxID=2509459 RepID=A0A4P6EN87_9MICO|nr:sigma-70 family RNA polymerase sigma factor [Xylanimonas allomyrinae]QAY64162.1 sigma-70 family RNA polymerase sigma factor [Xylanimonas allomyrinae]
MTDVYIEPGDQLPVPSDAELILEVRGGDLAAYGALYERHAAAARRLALSYVRNVADAEDVVADAFARVLGVLQSGQGPDQMFRAYLFTVVKNAAVELSRGHQRTHPTNDPATFESLLHAEPSSEDPALAGFEKSVVSRAYQSLPERWQAVLWYTEVEGCTPAEIASILGLTPNGVSALAYRAREGLRVGYLQQHLSNSPADGCRTINALLGGYVRGSLANREVAKVDAHLKTCGDCRTLVLELSDVAHGMRGVIAPLVLGVAGLGLIGALPLGTLVGASAAGTAAAGAVAGSAASGSAVGAAAAANAATGVAGSAVVANAGAAAGAGAATGAAAGAGAATGAAAGAGAATGAAAGAGAATGAAAGAGAATGAAAGAGAATGAAAGAAGAATSAAVAGGAATSAVASTVAATAGAGAILGGTSMAAAAGAVAIAAVGVVSMLQAISPTTDALGPPPSTVVTASASTAAPLTPGPAPSISPSDTSVLGQVFLLGEPARLVVAPVGTGTLQPRVPQRVTMKVLNKGEQTARDTTVRLSLATGLDPDLGSASVGRSASLLSPDAPGCSLGADGSGDVLCDLGDITGGAAATVAFDVLARDGGSYKISGEIWADGILRSPVDVPPAAVDPFGAELTAAWGTIPDLVNPGLGDLPLSVTNTGDVDAAAGWSVDVALPDGLLLAGADGLTCAAAADAPQSVTCTDPDAALSPDAQVAAVLHVVAPATSGAGAMQVDARPVVAGGHAVSSSGTFTVARPWHGAHAETGIAAVCAATGGVGTADATVRGTYRNTTHLAVTARLDAAGGSATSSVLTPGQSADLTVHDGLRVPAGTGTWTLTTTVAGTEYSTTLAAGQFDAVDCYDPVWDATTSAAVQNVGGTLQVAGTITNDTAEPFRVALRAAGVTSDPVTLDPGATTTLVLDTGLASLPSGVAEFDLYRWVADVDGDPPVQGVVPRTPVTAAYAGATVAPALGPLTGDPVTSACTYDPAAETSVRRARIPLDNTGSTLPVSFTVGGVTAVLPAGASQVLTVPVAYGTTSLDVLADGRTIGSVPVRVASCATLAWPQDVAVTAQAQCTAQHLPELLATVATQGGRSYDVRISRGGRAWSDPAPVTPAGPATVRLGLGDGLTARGGRASVEVSRVVEGRPLTAYTTVDYAAVSCVVTAPAARVALGGITVTETPDGPVSTRTAALVLDNTGSNVPVWFSVPDVVGGSVRVPAGQTRTVDAGVVTGSAGATYRVSARSWSTTLTVAPFTGTAGWCAPAWDRATQESGGYAAGAKVSFGSANYTYRGARVTDPDPAEGVADGSARANRGAGAAHGNDARGSDARGNDRSGGHGGASRGAGGVLAPPTAGSGWDAAGACETR